MNNSKLLYDTAVGDKNFHISQRFPSNQNQRVDNNSEISNDVMNNDLKNDNEMLMCILTMAKDCQTTVKILSKIKTHVSFDQNLKNLAY